ncbi:MAG: YciI family protein [Cytophagales bacterium]|nr:YciI family protein [Cytophagales bacterium]
MREEHLNENDQRLINQLEKELMPPTHIEEQLVNQLKFEGHIVKENKMNIGRIIIGIAASILLFLGGTWYGKTTSNQISITPEMGYMLLLHEDEQFTPGDPIEMFEEYAAWMQNTFVRGVKITGHELVNEAVLIRKGKPNEAQGEDAETRTTGYFILEANSLEEALAVAQENPHVKYGGTVEVKAYMVR